MHAHTISRLFARARTLPHSQARQQRSRSSTPNPRAPSPRAPSPHAVRDSSPAIERRQSSPTMMAHEWDNELAARMSSLRVQVQSEAAEEIANISNQLQTALAQISKLEETCGSQRDEISSLRSAAANARSLQEQLATVEAFASSLQQQLATTNVQRHA